MKGFLATSFSFIGTEAEKALQYFRYVYINYLNSFSIRDRVAKAGAEIGISLRIKVQKVDIRDPLFLKKAFERIPASLLLPRLTGREF